jgi:hypothetical protein
MRWRAFYADGRRVSSADCAWRELPAHGLVVAVWWDAHGQRHLDCGADGLVHTGDAIVGVNLPGVMFEEAGRYEAEETRCLKYGEYMQPDAWAAVRAEADDARVAP